MAEMSTPLPLFDMPAQEPPEAAPATRRRRFLASPSRVAYDALKPKLPRREAFVLAELAAYHVEQGDDPTGYELLAFARRRHPELPHLDVNSIRPRLTGLANEKNDRADGRTYVRKITQRKCREQSALAWTWRCL